MSRARESSASSSAARSLARLDVGELAPEPFPGGGDIVERGPVLLLQTIQERRGGPPPPADAPERPRCPMRTREGRMRDPRAATSPCRAHRGTARIARRAPARSADLAPDRAERRPARRDPPRTARCRRRAHSRCSLSAFASTRRVAASSSSSAGFGATRSISESWKRQKLGARRLLAFVGDQPVAFGADPLPLGKRRGRQRSLRIRERRRTHREDRGGSRDPAGPGGRAGRADRQGRRRLAKRRARRQRAVHQRAATSLCRIPRGGRSFRGRRAFRKWPRRSPGPRRCARGLPRRGPRQAGRRLPRG